MSGYNIGISNDIIEEQFKKWFGEDFVLNVEMRYQDKIANTKIEIIFTADEKALWICKYKGEYYGNALSNVFEKDKYTYIDVFYNLRENAIETLKKLKQ